MPCPVEPCLNRGAITTGHRSGGAMSGGTVPAGRKAGGCLAAPRRGAGDSPKGGNRRPEGAAALHQNSRTYGSTRGEGYGDFSRGWRPYGENQLMGDLGAFMEAWGSEGV